MWVRAVATAVAVWCVSGVAMAAGYQEVWNPPEASTHGAKPARKAAGAGKGDPAAGSRAAVKSASKHATSGRHTTQRIASSTQGGKKAATHGSVKKAAAKGATKGGATGAIKGPAAGKPKSPQKTAVMAQANKPHAQVAQAKSAQPKLMHANVAQNRPAHAQAVEVAAKPAAPHATAPAKSVNVSANPADAATNPATASSGSLPPILR
ncbi:UNVERIFIED_ORG: hypothetical protein ABIC54_003315 [Burkholderia sp. 1263]